MAVTITWDAGFNTNKSLNSAVARGKKMVTGKMNFSGLTYIDGGVTVSMAGFSTVDACWIEPQNGLFFNFDYTNQLVEVRIAGSATNTATIAALENTLQEIASGTSLGSYTAVRFWAMGD